MHKAQEAKTVEFRMLQHQMELEVMTRGCELVEIRGVEMQVEQEQT